MTGMMTMDVVRAFEPGGERASNPLRVRFQNIDHRPRRWILDIDHTLLKRVPGGRGPCDWSRVHEDVPNEPVVEIVRGLAAIGHCFLVVTGRLEVCRDATIDSLFRHVFNTRATIDAWHPHHLFMRDQAREFMPGFQLKEELYIRDIQPRWNVLGAIEDDPRAAEMYSRNGVFCVQVPNDAAKAV